MKPWYSSVLGRLLLLLFIGAAIVLSRLAHADVVEFSEDELSRESVLPVFDEPDAVKKRVVPTYGRIEAEIHGTTSLNDPWLNIYGIGVDVEYHLDEVNALGINASYLFSSNSSYVAQVQALNGGGAIPFGQNPTPSYLILGEYEFTPYYGKISITKQGVLNLNLSGTVRLGMMGFNASSSVTGGVGINERFFFTRNFGLKLDLAALIYQKTDIIALPNANATSFNFMVSLGALWYFPEL